MSNYFELSKQGIYSNLTIVHCHSVSFVSDLNIIFIDELFLRISAMKIVKEIKIDDIDT